ncbi:hypothetical protein [Dactylosporangium sp. CA-233914]|uniref:hypothetical protein n=1 Tax=Dactylosporangium sp. CA-233914 TaxID=3239934 RepID=UPI003D92519F
MQPVSVTYQRRFGNAWNVFLSTGERLTVDGELAEARAVVRQHIGGAEVGVERVDTLAGHLADAGTVVTGPQVRGLDHAREQFRRACALPVPDGFVRVVRELTGFEEEGSIGAIHLVLKERWDADRPS